MPGRHAGGSAARAEFDAPANVGRRERGTYTATSPARPRCTGWPTLPCASRTIARRVLQDELRGLELKLITNALLNQVFGFVEEPRGASSSLRRAYTVGDAPPGPGVEAVCQARRSLGGLTFRTRYVTFRRPELAAVTLVEPAPLFASWAASIRHVPLDSSRHEIAYTLTFRCRPAPLAPVIERVALLAFRWETRRRLRALAAAVGGAATPPSRTRSAPRRR